jgi:hypothetical protein
MKKQASSIVLVFAVLGCASSRTSPAPVADPEATTSSDSASTAAPVQTAVATAQPSAAPADSAPAGPHAGGPAVCEELAKACHDVGHGPGETGKCHEIGHKGDVQACEKERDRCLKLCADAAKNAGGHQHKH